MAKDGGIIRTALVEGAEEIVGGIPGGSTVLKVARKGFTLRANRIADELFLAIGVANGVHDATKAAELVEAHAVHDWFQDAIDAGFRDMLDAVDPAGRAAIATLVAEYVVHQRRPDAKYRRAGQVLGGLDGGALPTLAYIAADYCALVKNTRPFTRALIEGDVTRFAPGKPLFWIAAPAPEKGTTLSVRRKKDSHHFDDCVRALLSAGVGQTWSGLGDDAHGGDPILAFDPTDDAVMELLDTCLRVHEVSNQARQR